MAGETSIEVGNFITDK